MTRVVLALLIIAVAILACRERRLERELERIRVEQAALRVQSTASAQDRVASVVKGATLGQFLSDPLRRQYGLDVVNASHPDRALIVFCQKFRKGGMSPAACKNVPDPTFQ